jgi:hypothetical protein
MIVVISDLHFEEEASDVIRGTAKKSSSAVISIPRLIGCVAKMG